MTIHRHPVNDRASWLTQRQSNVNASEVGALFGVHPYKTPYEIYLHKSGIAPQETGEESAVMRRGRLLEDAVAAAVAEARPDWRIEKAIDYVVDDELRLGATPDFIVHCPKRGRGVLQTKTVGWHAMPAWGVEKVGDWEADAFPPLWIQLQTSVEIRQENVSWGAIGAMLVDDTIPLAVLEFDRHPGTEARLVKGVADFWTRIAAGQPPDPDYARDADLIRDLYPIDNGDENDLSTDDRIAALLERREELSSIITPAEKEKNAINAEITAKIGEYSRALVPGWRITRKLQSRKAIAASEFRVLRVTRIKE